MATRQRFDPEQLVAQVWDVSKKSVTLGGQAAPRHFSIVLKHPGWPVRMDLGVTVDPDRGPIASGLSTTRLGRDRDRPTESTDVPTYRELDEILRATVDVNVVLRTMTAEAVGVWHAHRMQEQLADADDAGPHNVQQARDELAETYEAGRRIAEAAIHFTEPRRRRVVSGQHLADVASCYREAMKEGLPPTQHVAERFHVSHSTAARWVRRARDAGELGRATGPRPGEAEQS